MKTTTTTNIPPISAAHAEAAIIDELTARAEQAAQQARARFLRTYVADSDMAPALQRVLMREYAMALIGAHAARCAARGVR